jgi:hypothetical protein
LIVGKAITRSTYAGRIYLVVDVEQNLLTKPAKDYLA